MRKALVALLAGCMTVVGEPEPADLGGLVDLAEAYCKAHEDVPCGHVWLCEAQAENPLGHWETCVLDEYPIEKVEAVLGPCTPTPRHQGLCYHHCTPGAGCNAYSGCWCEETP